MYGIHGTRQLLFVTSSYNKLMQLAIWNRRKRQAISYIGILEKQDRTATNLLFSVIFLKCRTRQSYADCAALD